MYMVSKENAQKVMEILEEDYLNGTMPEKIRDNPSYPFSQFDDYEVIPTPDHIIIEKNKTEINVLFIIILVLSILLFYFGFVV